MKFEIAFDRIYPHPIEKVWTAVTDAALLSRWLMETDFELAVGREFNMWCDDGEGGTDRYVCKVLEFDPPRQMRWSWLLHDKKDLEETLVEFVLAPVEAGTRLTVRHSGDRDPSVIEAFRGGWPYKLRELENALR